MSDTQEKRPVSVIVKRILLITLILAFVGIIVWVIIAGSLKDDTPEVVNREYDEAEVAAAARELIEKSILINDIYWYNGIPTDENEDGLTLKSYMRADKSYLESKGITLLSDLKNITRGVFSSSESEYLFSIFLKGGTDGDFTGIAHYIPEYKIDSEGGEKEEIGILVSKKRTDDTFIKVGERTDFNYDSIRVIASEAQRVKIEIECTVTTANGLTQKRTKAIYLVEEADGWRLDNQTKIAYLTDIN